MDTEQKDQAERKNNLAAWNAAGHKYPEIEAMRVKFKARVDASLGPNPSPTKEALAISAVALYTGVLLLDNRLIAARGRANRIADLLELLPVTVGALQRTLRALSGGDAEDAPGDRAGGLAEYLARRSQPQTTATAVIDSDGEDSDGRG